MSPIMVYFDPARSPGPLREVAKLVAALAVAVDCDLPDNAEKSAGLRKLLEARDCFERAVQYP